jgi:hypothetical protein
VVTSVFVVTPVESKFRLPGEYPTSARSPMRELNMMPRRPPTVIAVLSFRLSVPVPVPLESVSRSAVGITTPTYGLREKLPPWT